MQSVSLEQIRVKGLEALRRELGVAGATRFLQLFETGSGDYSKERHNLFKGATVAKLAAQIRRSRKG
ncbi:MAG: hypothetical protein EXS18_00995 [Verrucomicrobiae bacterium]|nr:hypothetical protein [Verrucomicrobiae bacterium]